MQEMRTPSPAKGEVLVKVEAALTCGTDLKAFLRGHPMIPMPGVLGHEFSGTVAATGRGVRKFKEADEIMAVHSAPCRACRYCKKRLHNLCEHVMDTKVLGAFAEYVLLPPHIVSQNIFHKPAGLSFEDAAFLEPLSCVVHGMQDLRIRANDSVLIIGAGPIGLLHLLLAQRKGARVIIAGLEEERLRLARRLGAHAAVAPSGIEGALRELTGGLGADYVFECTGTVEVWERSVSYARRGGTVILFGGCREGTKVVFDTYRLHYDALTVRGVFHYMPRDVRAAYELLKDGINVSPLISGRYPLADLKSPFERLSRGEGIKYVIKP